jgi:hypothetical protein
LSPFLASYCPGRLLDFLAVLVIAINKFKKKKKLKSFQTNSNNPRLANMTIPNIKLSSGYDMPQVGFGLWKVENDVCADVVYNAIKAGYRLFDGACGKFASCDPITLPSDVTSRATPRIFLHDCPPFIPTHPSLSPSRPKINHCPPP